MLVAVVFFGSVVGVSVAGALRAPGTDSVAARLAEWGRDHGFDGLITWLEKQQYEHNRPPTGGVPVGGIPRIRRCRWHRLIRSSVLARPICP
ncbi:MAG: hypothetical protein WBF76_06515, partial [Pseudonocardiaceae bacterium]